MAKHMVRLLLSLAGLLGLAAFLLPDTFMENANATTPHEAALWIRLWLLAAAVAAAVLALAIRLATRLSSSPLSPLGRRQRGFDVLPPED